MKTLTVAWLIPTALLIGASPAQPQDPRTADTLAGAASASARSAMSADAIVERLDQIEAQNVALRDEVEALRREIERLKQPDSDGSVSTIARLGALDERMNLHEVRLSEQGQVKAESARRVPIQLTGMILFNLFRNSHHGTPAGMDYPLSARVESAPSSFGATLRQNVFGLDLQTPQALFGGQFRGSFFIDMSEAGEMLTNIQPRLNTAAVEGRWNRWAILDWFGVSQERDAHRAHLCPR